MSLPKNFQEFKETLEAKQPPKLWPESLKALWWDALGDWHNAHDIAQDIRSEAGCRIHAYLHRKEGDKWNAGYWYDKANRPFFEASSDEEFKELVCGIIEEGR
jgi:hypothetical protein